MSSVDPDSDMDPVDAQAGYRQRRRQGGLDAGTKRLAVIAGGIGGLLILVVGGWSLFGHHMSGIPVISPVPGPLRVKPVNPGGMQVMGAQPLLADNGSAARMLAPGPETADPQALKAQVEAARKADAPAVATPAPIPPKIEPQPHSSDRPAAAAPTEAAPAPALPEEKSPPRQEAAPASSSTDAAVEPQAPESAPAPAGRDAVQLGALGSEAAAQAEWARLVHAAPALFAGRHPQIVEASRSGKSFYRLRTGGFGSIADATEFCGRAKAQGIACTLADF